MSPIAGIQPDTVLIGLIDRAQRLGRGTSRDVYAVVDNDDVVVKESTLAFHYSNFVEWTVWHAVVKAGEDIMGNVPNSELKDLFAQCYAISESGRFLMMERLTGLTSEDRMPPGHVLPDWLNDKKPSAFGKARGGTVKIMDYGLVDFYSVLNPKNRTGIC